MNNTLQNTLFDLSQQLSLLKVTGASAGTFLQGQISCDINAVQVNHIQQGAFCNLKGRVLSLADIMQFNDAFYLIIATELIEKISQSLSKTAALSRVALNQDNDYHVFGFYLTERNGLLPFDSNWPGEKYALISDQAGCAYHLGHGFYIVLLSSVYCEQVKRLFMDHNRFEGYDQWHRMRLKRHYITIDAESSGLFFPHRLDLHLSEFISFNKGCYKGQEIIARMHYRAQQKHTLKVFTITTQAILKKGMRLMDENGEREIGELVDFSLLPNTNKDYLIAASLLHNHPEVVYLETNHDPIRLMPLAQSA